MTQVGQSLGALTKNSGIENTGGQIRSLLSRMAAVRLPKIQIGVLPLCDQPGVSNRCETCIQFMGNSHITQIDLDLQAFGIREAGLGPAVAVGPSQKEDGG